jgi:hypothetical protein
MGGVVMGGKKRTMLLFNGFIELLQSLVLRRETAFRGCVYDEEDFAFVGVEGDGLAFLWRRVGSALWRGKNGGAFSPGNKAEAEAK